MSVFFACATAGFLNAYCMRVSELERGIDVLDGEGRVVGKSKEAAKKAVLETAISRVILCLPLFIPASLMYALERRNRLPKNFWLLTSV